MVSAYISKLIMLVFGTLFPAYRSYKAIKNKDLREYVKWMMYWIIFALFITGETFADIFLSWLPLYYEIKIVFVIWLLSPATKGSSILYRKFVHPRLKKHEKAIDKYISEAQTRGYSALMDVGRKGFSAAADTLVKTAVVGQHQFFQTVKRYNSMQELKGTDTTDVTDFDKRSTWYGAPSNDANYNPENDVDILQQQYKPTRAATFNEEDLYEGHNEQLQHSQSELNLQSESLFYPKIYELSDNEEMRNNPTEYGAPSTSEYTTASNTLPRRKQKKPLYESIPNDISLIGNYNYSSYRANTTRYTLRSRDATY